MVHSKVLNDWGGPRIMRATSGTSSIRSDQADSRKGDFITASLLLSFVEKRALFAIPDVKDLLWTEPLADPPERLNVPEVNMGSREIWLFCHSQSNCRQLN